ncbi:MAG: hypothetical protein KF851_02565 [Pirellulaceae bacterium]|nr:hypothetical protein [Pirellulaceae bacterium]
MQYWSVEEINRHALADHEAETEIAPGVVILRRSILKFGIAGATTLLGGKTLLAGTNSSKALAANLQDDQKDNAIQSANDLTVAELVSQLHPQARELISAGDPNEAA